MDTAQDALRRAAAAIEVNAGALAERIAEYMHGEVRELPGDPQTREELRRGAENHVRSFLRALRRGEPLDAIAPAPEALAAARALARSGRPLEPVLRACHFGHHAFLDAWEQELPDKGRSDDVVAKAVRLAQQHTFRWLDGLIRQLSAEYERERTAATRNREAVRAATVRAILAGEVTDPAAVSRAISYELHRHHVGFVLWARAAADEATALPQLTGAAHHLAATLTVPAGGGLLWAWAAASTVAEEALADTAADGVSVAVGEPAFGFEGFRRTHRDAAEAARVAMLAPSRDASVVHYRDIELVALLTRDVERARRFARSQLAGLAKPGDDYATLRTTLAAYLDELGARGSAAARIGVHPNTVSNRIGACAELLGRDPLHAGTELAVALRLAEMLGCDD